MSPEEIAEFKVAPWVDLNDRDAVHKIIEIHIQTRPGDPWWIRHIWGVDRTGQKVQVKSPLNSLPREGRGAWSGALMKMFEDAGRFGKAMGVWKPDVIVKESERGILS